MWTVKKWHCSSDVLVILDQLRCSLRLVGEFPNSKSAINGLGLWLTSSQSNMKSRHHKFLNTSMNQISRSVRWFSRPTLKVYLGTWNSCSYTSVPIFPEPESLCGSGHIKYQAGSMNFKAKKSRGAQWTSARRRSMQQAWVGQVHP